jgi:hypothetical protein
MKNSLPLFALSAVLMIGLAGCDKPTTTESGDKITETILPDSSGNKNVDSQGSLINEKGNRIDLKGNPEPTLSKQTDKEGRQLDQNGVPIENGLDSRVSPPEDKAGK